MHGVPQPRIRPAEDGLVLQCFLLKKTLCVSGPMQFKPMLFKDQLWLSLFEPGGLKVARFFLWRLRRYWEFSFGHIKFMVYVINQVKM